MVGRLTRFELAPADSLSAVQPRHLSRHALECYLLSTTYKLPNVKNNLPRYPEYITTTVTVFAVSDVLILPSSHALALLFLDVPNVFYVPRLLEILVGCLQIVHWLDC